MPKDILRYNQMLAHPQRNYNILQFWMLQEISIINRKSERHINKMDRYDRMDKIIAIFYCP